MGPRLRNDLATTAVVLVLLVSAAGQQRTVHKRFEYKYSFKPPYLAQKDGSVPFFEYSGNALASEENVRVAPSLRSQKGMIWTKETTNFDWWEVEIVFRVTGRGRVGADGLAFWYTMAKGIEGPVFGSSDQWIGLGVFFDSFDNDNKHNNPYIMAMVNDGSKNFDHQNDGATQQLGGCLRDFRNKPFPVKARIEYYQNVLTVLFHNGMSNNDKDFELCIRAENVILPKNGYFGLSAATGGLADDHDVNRFITHSLRSPEMALVSESVDTAESKKFEEEFKEYQEKLSQQKKEWAKENPDKVKKEEDWDEFFEDDNTRELKQIFEGQSMISDNVRELQRKLDEIIGRQERSLSLLTNIQNSGVRQQGGAAPQVGGGVPVDTIRRDEVTAILNNQREMVNAARDMKNFITDIHNKVSNIQATQNRGTGTAQQVAGPGTASLPPELLPIVNEIREGVNNVRREMSNSYARLHQQQQAGKVGGGAPVNGGGCPDVSCASTPVVLGLLVGQFILLMIYFMYRDSKEAAAKKFY